MPFLDRFGALVLNVHSEQHSARELAALKSIATVLISLGGGDFSKAPEYPYLYHITQKRANSSKIAFVKEAYRFDSNGSLQTFSLIEPAKQKSGKSGEEKKKSEQKIRQDGENSLPKDLTTFKLDISEEEKRSK